MKVTPPPPKKKSEYNFKGIDLEFSFGVVVASNSLSQARPQSQQCRRSRGVSIW